MEEVGGRNTGQRGGGSRAGHRVGLGFDSSGSGASAGSRARVGYDLTHVLQDHSGCCTDI